MNESGRQTVVADAIPRRPDFVKGIRGVRKERKNTLQKSETRGTRRATTSANHGERARRRARQRKEHPRRRVHFNIENTRGKIISMGKNKGRMESLCPRGQVA